MKFGVVFEKIVEADFPQGYFYAHIPTLSLTTHGEGIEGARTAAYDLIKLWIEEKIANG
jgi:predicted RNase H-like HicB family nuclease